jgi:hypothetical protein
MRPDEADRTAMAGSGTVAGLDQSMLRQLYATVPTEFVAARNAVVKELRRAKERDDAAIVAAFRRPDWTDWALNVAAGERRDAVDEFVSAAGDVRDAQTAAIEGRDGPDVRTALRTLRDRTADVIRAAGAALERAGRPPGTAELTARLSEIAGSVAACEQMRMGVLGSGDVDVSDPFAGLQPAGRPSPRPDAPAKKRAAAVGGKTAKPAPTAAAPSAADRQRARREREVAERAHKSAVRELSRAEADLDRATDAVAVAREKLAEAERGQALATEHRLAMADKLAEAEAALQAVTSLS